MKIKEGFVIRKVGESNIVVPVGDACNSFHGMIKLNKTGEFLWNLFSSGSTEDDAVKALLDQYEVSEEIARNDVKKFIEIITKNGFID